MGQSVLRALLLLAVGFSLSPSTASRLLQQATGLSTSLETDFPFHPINAIDVNHVLSLRAPDSVGSAQRAPISLTVVLDRSGSMRGEKISLLKKSTEFLATQLGEIDSFGVVSFAGDVTVDIPLGKVTSDFRSRARSKIQEIRARGATNLSGGLFKGIEQQRSGDVDANAIKVVVIFTDGLANRGLRKIEDITARLAQETGGSSAPSIFALGFGGDHDGSFLQAIAEGGDGSYVFIQDESVIAPTFGEIIGGLLSTTAQGITVTFVPQNGARIESVKGGQVTTSGSTWITKFPNLFAEENRDILIGMKVPAISGPQDQLVLKTKVSYFDVLAKRNVETDLDAVLRRIARPQARKINRLVEVTDLRFKVSEDISSALEQKQTGNNRGASATLDGTLAKLNTADARNDPEVQALTQDVQSVQQEVSSSQSLNTATLNKLNSGGAAIATQRAVGSGSSGFASRAQASRSQRVASVAAASFVEGGR